MTDERARGRAAFLAGEPFDMSEIHLWQFGYGDAITIEPVAASSRTPVVDVLEDDDWQDHCGDLSCEICPDPSGLVTNQL